MKRPPQKLAKGSVVEKKIVKKPIKKMEKK